MVTQQPSTRLTWCPYCGRELPSKAIRCSSCGHWLPVPGVDGISPATGADLSPGAVSVPSPAVGAAEGESKQQSSEREAEDKERESFSLPSIRDVITALSALTIVLSPLYLLGLWGLRQRIADLHHLDFWTSWYAANQVPKYVIAINGLMLLLSPSIVTFVGVALISAVAQRLQTWMQNSDEDVLQAVQIGAVRARDLVRWTPSPGRWLTVSCISASVVGVLNYVVGLNPIMTIPNGAVILTFLIFYVEYALAPEERQTPRFLGVAAVFMYMFVVPLMYSVAQRPYPPLWALVVAALGTGLGTWLVAGLVRGEIRFSVRLVAVFLLAYLPLLIPSYVWNNWSSSFADLPLPHVTVCVKSQSHATPLAVTGELVDSTSNDVLMLPDRLTMRHGKFHLQPGTTLVSISTSLVQVQVAANRVHISCNVKDLVPQPKG